MCVFVKENHGSEAWPWVLGTEPVDASYETSFCGYGFSTYEKLELGPFSIGLAASWARSSAEDRHLESEIS